MMEFEDALSSAHRNFCNANGVASCDDVQMQAEDTDGGRHEAEDTDRKRKRVPYYSSASSAYESGPLDLSVYYSFRA